MKGGYKWLIVTLPNLPRLYPKSLDLGYSLALLN